jgi:pyruvate dehydrogenase E2 component (dihydrolipoamide acetyltransferase)
MALSAFTMPKWGIEMSEGMISEWFVKEGEPFEAGIMLATIETDKITNEVEAEAAGCFVRLVAQPGETHPVGALIAVLGDPATPAPEIDAFIAGFRPADTSFAGTDGNEPDVARPAAPPASAVIPDGTAISPRARALAEARGADASAIAGSGRRGRITLQDVEQALKPARAPALAGAFESPPADPAVFASPLARRLAARHGIDLSSVAGSGRHGRIAKADVLALVSAPRASAIEPDIRPMTPMRKAIARRLTESKQQIPHFYVRRRVRADRMLARRAAAPEPRPSVNDLLLEAVAAALIEVPEVNIQVHGDTIHRFAMADIAVAVATDRGLLTPVVRGADRLSLADLSANVADLASRARAGKVSPEEFEGGSFTLSNLGPFGVEQFDAIINPPQGAILAVGAARPEPIDEDGAIRIVPVLHLSLSCDHRAIDGADAARFLAALARRIEAA